MDLRQLRYFVGIVQAGSLTRAADQLHVAQSAISHHLASLESELNRQLVTRGPKGIQLTEAGRVLYRHAEAILRHVEFAKQDAMCALNVPSGRVSIGFPARIGGTLKLRDVRASAQLLTRRSCCMSPTRATRWCANGCINGRLDMALLFVEQPERGPDDRAAPLRGTILCDGRAQYFAHHACRCGATAVVGGRA